VEILTPSTTTVVATGTTTAAGVYTIGVADGTYDVRVTPPLSSGLGPSTALGIIVSGPTTLDFALVSSSVTTFGGRLLDAAEAGGTAVANAGDSSTNAFSCELTFGPVAACGASNYAFNGSTPAATTDGSGNVTLFLFQTPSTLATSYTITATPSAASGLAAGRVSGVPIGADTTGTLPVAPPTVLSGRLLDGVCG